ncbi:MAG: DUF4998 domain-containing protein [Prevotella sp.]|nr:DUF4998 domain-containing protein [Prevotella sp.]
MKPKIYIMAMALLCLVVASCKDQKDIYQEWVKKGGYIYPEKANDLGFMRGYNRMLLQWQYPKDPSVTHATVYWTNRTDSLNIDYKDYAGKDTVNLVIDGLTERAYTFEVVNYDRDGNTSMVSEITATPYAENWLATHAEREIFSAEIVGDHALIQTGFGTDEMVKTQYRYVNAEGDTIYLDKPQDTKTASVELPGAAPGKRFQFRSAFCPANGIDTIWNSWRSSPTPIAGKLDPEGWTATATTGITLGAYPTKNIFDGYYDIKHAWWSNNKTYPKIVVIDTHKDSYMINKIAVYQGSAYTYRSGGVVFYFGNEPFNPDAGANYAETAPFKNALFSKSIGLYWGTSTIWCVAPTFYNCRYIAIVFTSTKRNGSVIFEAETYGYDSKGN